MPLAKQVLKASKVSRAKPAQPGRLALLGRPVPRELLALLAKQVPKASKVFRATPAQPVQLGQLAPQAPPERPELTVNLLASLEAWPMKLACLTI